MFIWKTIKFGKKLELIIIIIINIQEENLTQFFFLDKKNVCGKNN